jgi:hypothetical protein
VQTHGESINFNPHIHGISSSGVFGEDGTFYELDHLDADKLAVLFAHHVLKALRGKELITDEIVAQILSQQHTGFSAWWGEKINPSDESYRLFLACYVDRGPIANSHIEITDDIVTYHTDKDPLTREFDVLEFLARITPQIPDIRLRPAAASRGRVVVRATSRQEWGSTVRYYGYYAHRARGARNAKKRLAERALGDADTAPFSILEPPPEQNKKASRSWAALLKRVFELEPLVCPRCGGTMHSKGFITDTKEVARLLDNLGVPGFVTPEKICGPPLQFIPEPQQFSS